MNSAFRSRVKFFRFALVASLLWTASCVGNRTERAPDALTVFSSEHLYSRDHHPLCKALVDSYCSFLYAPGTGGNIQIRRANSSVQILEGQTGNQFSQVYYRYALAKIRNQKYLPKDFYRILARHNYFGKLETFLDRKAITDMDLHDRLVMEQTDYELSFIWESALNEALIIRMDKQFPGYHKIPDDLVPIELEVKRRRLKRILISEISQALWRNDRNWERVENNFNALKQSFYRVFDKLDIADDVRNDWKNRIAEVKLVLPGAFPEISDEECSTTTANAYYYTYLNVITVCAGDFNSEDIVQTLAHEMAHALGVDRSEYLFENDSDFGKELTGLRHAVCRPASFKCDAWKKYKESFDDGLASLDGFEPQLPGFQRCLKRRVTSKTLHDSDIEKFSNTTVTDRISEFASSDRFLRITKAKIPMRNGKTESNPNYLNPCSYYLWSKGEEPIDDELTTLLYFTAEYRCSDEPEDSKKFRGAIEIARRMSEQVMEKTIKIEGEFSGRNLLETEGFSSPPFERFADVVGSYALSEYLSSIPDQYVRQNTYLASISWMCLEPSLATHFPEESSIEKQYVYDSHTGGDQRIKELLSAPVRKAIGCQKDFQFHECTLPFKEKSKPDSHLPPILEAEQ